MPRQLTDRVWAHNHRKVAATCVALRDPLGTLSGYSRAGRRHLDRFPSGVLSLYCDGQHLYVDTEDYKLLSDDYERGIYHRGLHLVRRKDFTSPRMVRGGVYRHWQCDVVFLRHDGFSGKSGARTAHVWFSTGSQFSSPWHFSIPPGSVLNLIADHEDWHLETVWMRHHVKMNQKLCYRLRHLQV